VLESALAQLPQLPDETTIVVRADSGGSAKAFLAYLHDASVMFSISVRLSGPILAAIRALHAHTSVWTSAVTQGGELRDGAHVAEATGLVDLDGYPAGTRLIVRREPLHPGAQQTFDDVDGHRFTAFVTDQSDTDLAALDARHRAHARVEARIRDAKDTGMANLPSADFAINTIWLQLVLAAQDLLAFLAALALDGRPRRCRAKNHPLAAAARRRAHHHQRAQTHAAAGPRLALGGPTARRVPQDQSTAAVHLTTRAILDNRHHHRGGSPPPHHTGLPPSTPAQADDNSNDTLITRNKPLRSPPGGSHEGSGLVADTRGRLLSTPWTVRSDSSSDAPPLPRCAAGPTRARTCSSRRCTAYNGMRGKRKVCLGSRQEGMAPNRLGKKGTTPNP
jgi:hypothetical protein